MPIDPSTIKWDTAPQIDPSTIKWDDAPKSKKQADIDTSEPTIEERLLGTPGARFAIGAASPVVGALQLGANLGDRIAATMGLDPTVGQSVADAWNKVKGMSNKGFRNSWEGYDGTDIAGLIGNVATAMASGPVSAATRAGRVAQGARIGAVFGAAQPGTVDLGDSATGAVMGAGVGAAAPVVIPAAVKAAGWVGDRVVGPTMAQLRAAKIARDTTGSKLAQVRQAMSQARPGITAGQAAEEAGINVPAFQSMNAMGARNNSMVSSDDMLRQAADRAGSLKAVTPDLGTAVGARSVISDLNYGKAFAADEARQAALAQQAAHNNAFGGTGGTIPVERVSPELQALRGNPVIDAAMAAAKARAPGTGDPMETLRGLHTMKVAIDAQMKNPLLPTSLQSMDKAALTDAKTQLVKAIEKQFPDYKLARTDHTAMSVPVEQSKILNQLTEVLDNAGVGERGMPFLNALGRGEDAMINRSGVDAAFGGLEQKLAPHQMDAVNNVASELSRDIRMGKSATLGNTELTKIMNQDTISLRKMIPSWLNRGVSATTKGLDLAESAISKKTIQAIADATASGQSMGKLLDTLPMVERNKILKAMIAANPTMLKNAAVVGSVNALSSSENQNALSPP